MNGATETIDARLPRYEQIRESLRMRISNGEWKPGTALPAETELAEQYGVALGTMRKAIAMVVEDGLVERAHGKGTFVRSEMQHASMFRFFRFRENPQGEALTVPHTVIHDMREVTLEPEIGERLHAGRSRRGIFLLRTRRFADGPGLLERIWLPFQPFKSLLKIRPEQFGDLLYPFYREHCGIAITRASETISFGGLTKEDALLLDMAQGDPVAVIERTAFSLEGEAVEFRITQGDARKFYYNVEIR